MDASVSNISYQGKDLDSEELGGQIAWVEPSLMERVQGYMIYLAILPDGTGRSQVGGEVPAGTHDTALFPEQPRGVFDFFTVYTRSSLAEQTTPVHLAIEDEVSYARNVSFVDDDLDEFEIGGWLQWRIPVDASEVTHYIVYLAENEAGANRSLLGNVTVGTHEFLVPADIALESFRFLTVFARSSLAEQTTPRFVEIIDTVSSVSNIGFIDKDLDWDELGGYVNWQPPPSHSQVLFYELYLAESATGKNRLHHPGASIPVGTTEVLWPAETAKAAFTHLAVYTKSWLAEQTTPVALEFEDKVSLVSDIAFPDFDLDLEDIGGNISWEAPNDTSQVTHYIVYLGQAQENSTEANGTRTCSNTSYLNHPSEESNVSAPLSDWCLLTYMGNTSVGVHNLFIPPDTGVPPYTHLAVFTLSSLVEQTTPMTLLFWDEVASVSNIRFVDQDLDVIDLGGEIHWDAPSAMRRVSEFLVELATDELVPTDRSQIGLNVPAGTNQILAPADTEPLHYTRFVVYTKSTLAEQTTPVGYHFVDKSSPVLNISFFDFDLDETDLYGDLLWEAPLDEDEVLQYLVYMAENSTGKERSLVGIANKGVHNMSIVPETPLLNYTHFLIYTASPLSEQTTPAAHLIFDAVASVSDIGFEDRDLDVQEVGGNVTWTAPAVEDRVELYRIYVANSPTGDARFQVASEVAGTIASKVATETPIPAMSNLLIYTQSALMEQTTPAYHAITDNFASVSNITFPEFDLDAGDLGGELSWDPPEDESLVTAYNIYFGKVVPANASSEECRWEVVTPKVALITGVTSFAMEAATAAVVEAAVKAALAQSFSIPEAAVSVSVTLFTGGNGRRLEDNEDGDSPIWHVSLQLSVPPTEAEAKLAALQSNAGDLAAALGLEDQTAVAALAESFAKAKVRTEVADQTLAVAQHDTLEPEDGHEADTRQLSVQEFVDPAVDAMVAWCRKTYRTVGTSDLQITVPVETPRNDFTHFVIYTASTLVEQSTPTALGIFDANATVSGVDFVDDDLDPLEFGGNVTWQEPSDSDRVQDYLLYFAEDELGSNRSRVGNVVPVGTSRELLPPEISQVPAFTHLVIYTRSWLVEQSTPASFALSDTISMVSNIVFEDLDLDFNDLGSNITWTEPSVYQQVTEYYVYLADGPEPLKITGDNGNMPWTGRSQLGVVSVGTELLFVPPETPRNGYSHVVIYASSDLVEQTTPQYHVIHDANASVSNVDFVGKDLDLEDLGGVVSWNAPGSDWDRVIAYAVYLSLDDIGTNRSQIEQDVPFGTNMLLTPAETPRNAYTRFVVYTKSTLVEQTTPTAHSLFDTSALARDLDFLDIDVDRGEVAGNLTWEPPSDEFHVIRYNVYLSENAYGQGRQYLGNVSVGIYEFFIPLDTPLYNHTHLLVYSESTLAEMTTPAALELIDSIAIVDNITLFDRDLDENEVGGEITWDPPPDERIVDLYRVYFQSDRAGTVKFQLDTDKPPGDLLVNFPENTNITGMAYIGIFITAFGNEQQTPSSVAIAETISSVGFVSFPDRDLDALEIGGTLSWGPPFDVTYNQDYVLYMATSATGTGRSGTPFGVVPVGTNSFSVPADTVFDHYTHWVVYTRSVAYEQSTPVGTLL
ncbi:unnamed protein product [Symbiodinium natans]|uniref:Uncharacterized protein n=1 Tax=Symbiodinium natans TaxID=878477 RepID=A0A812G580_9DINO|nr:unnamed protein product [Symbiodinium natans]